MQKPVWSCTARAYKDAERKTSAAGNSYTKIPVTIEVEPAEVGAKPEDRPKPLFCGLMVFGRDAERAAEVEKGDQVMFLGAAERRTYQAEDGSQREHWSIMCSGFKTAGGEFNGGGQQQRRQPQPQQTQQQPGRAAAPAGEPWDDPPF